eukprot:TRINITY_DN32748_c0_g3_i3.p1 TRINITY_DN32748_c0_g3~~TRINITY_DN32748_c0_g3_i3.p1  ORF type:complete len:178 (-),score=14.82 TRINITY_DN32748_c0_g3_i3:78-611(-)
MVVILTTRNMMPILAMVVTMMMTIVIMTTIYSLLEQRPDVLLQLCPFVKIKDWQQAAYTKKPEMVRQTVLAYDKPFSRMQVQGRRQTDLTTKREKATKRKGDTTRKQERSKEPRKRTERGRTEEQNKERNSGGRSVAECKTRTAHALNELVAPGTSVSEHNPNPHLSFQLVRINARY